ncbi:MAG: nucleotidyltransferase domain-containing protein [Candidatus Eisenbacteria bacterium]
MPDGPTDRTAVIHEMVRVIVKHFHPEKVVLFGSHARGDAGEDSDVDLLIVMPIEGSRRQKRLEIRLALHDLDVPKDVVVVTPTEYESQRDLPGTLVHEARRGGRVLYDHAA